MTALGRLPPVTGVGGNATLAASPWSDGFVVFGSIAFCDRSLATTGMSRTVGSPLNHLR